MHPEAFRYVAKAAADVAPDVIVVECGSRNVNGSVRDLFPLARYAGVDIAVGPGVDIVADFRAIAMLEAADVVVCCEVLEHDSDPASLVAKCREVLRPGGRLIMTCAGVGRPAHSAVDGGPLREGEHYRNVSEQMLEDWLTAQGWSEWSIDVSGCDTRCTAWR